MVKIGKYDYTKSNRKNKKLQVKVGNKIIHFGDSRYQHFKDETKLYSNLDHYNLNRKENYLKRSKSIKNKKGELTWLNPESANYHAIRVLRFYNHIVGYHFIVFIKQYIINGFINCMRNSFCFI